MPIGLDPAAFCDLEYEGVKIRARYMTIGQRIRMVTATNDAMKATDDNEALTGLLAAFTVAGVVDINGKPMSADTIADTFTMREAFVLLYRLPSMISDLENDLKKVSPSPSPSAPDTSAPTAPGAVPR